MLKRKMNALIALVVVMMLVFTGCASKPAEETATKDGAKDYKIVLVLPGPINDQGWNATAYAGLQMVEKDMGIKMEYVESVQQADFEATFRDYGEKKYDLVFGHGIQFLDAAKKIAPQYPDTYFMIINSEEGIAPNVGGIGIREWEGGYVAGTIAGMNTTSKKLGAIGSFPFPVIEGTLDAFEAGAMAVDPSISVSKTYVNSWDDISKGKETATAMIESGADVVFCSANQVGLGSIDAAKTNNVKAVGYIAPQNDVAKGTVLASIVYNTPKLFEFVVKKLVDGTLKPEGISQGWAEGVLGMEWTDQITDEQKSKVEEVIKSLKEGKIENPYKEGE
ncbi:BMP family protein [Helicovermis profundi]|uniref:BMP family protein n=1 Tax=Helicovermis profundi TaxID=3065157 RepID=A0AAU9EWH7_9FIRM|nr:BMP family protein [Clostridia bacterium S502]